MKVSAKFIIGMVLIVANYLVGWIGLFGFSVLSLRLHKPVLNLVGLGLYGLSWGMYGLGLLLTGPEGVRWLWDRLRALVKGRRKTNP